MKISKARNLLTSIAQNSLKRKISHSISDTKYSNKFRFEQVQSLAQTLKNSCFRDLAEWI